MDSFMKKFKKKGRVSSELHSRWGDTSISYPNDGSWNQWDQPSGFAANVCSGSRNNSYADDTRRYIAMDHAPPQSPGMSECYDSRNIDTCDSMHAGSAFPKGYYDENIRHRPNRYPRQQARGLAISVAGDDMNDRIEAGAQEESCDESCDEDDEKRDTLKDQKLGSIHRNYVTRDTSGSSPRLISDPYSDHSARSPPLSVTSRMRHFSVQSSMTEQSSSVAETVSSGRTSYTAVSSVSAPSFPPGTPRHAYNTAHVAYAEKRPTIPRPRYREPDRVARNELVPSYDELYG